MMYGIKINGIDTLTAYGLALLSDLSVSAPKLKENYVDVPGADGSLNMSYALAGEPTYKDRDITGTLFKRVDDFALSKIAQSISNAYHGRSVKIQIPTDTDHYFTGVIQFGGADGYNSCKIPFSARVNPWRYKSSVTAISRNDLTANYKTMTLTNERRPVVPTITVTEETTLLWGTATYTIAAGTYKLPDIVLVQGSNTLKAKLTTAASGSITVEYQEASL